jgi:methylated-DNA-[protein]-cysteine S-methyltransferase
MQDTAWTTHDTPIGTLTVVTGPAGIRRIHFPDERHRLAPARRASLAEVTEQLDQYFAGERHAFELEVDLDGEPLQRAVWEQLKGIPYGETTTYGELAARVDDSLFPAGLEPYRRVRLAAAAIGLTPTPIVVPCHRVIGADGSLTGYGGGLDRKRALLDLESAALSPRLC